MKDYSFVHEISYNGSNTFPLSRARVMSRLIGDYLFMHQDCIVCFHFYFLFNISRHTYAFATRVHLWDTHVFCLWWEEENVLHIRGEFVTEGWNRYNFGAFNYINAPWTILSSQINMNVSFLSRIDWYRNSSRRQNYTSFKRRGPATVSLRGWLLSITRKPANHWLSHKHCRLFFSQNAGCDVTLFYTVAVFSRGWLSLIFRNPVKYIRIESFHISSSSFRPGDGHVSVCLRLFILFLLFFFLFCYFAQSKELIRAVEFRRLSRDQVRNICRMWIYVIKSIFVIALQIRYVQEAIREWCVQ